MALAGGCHAAKPTPVVHQGTREVEILQAVMREQERYVKLHAAEGLIAVNQPAGVYETFKAEAQAFGDEPMYRVVIWRVLAKSALDDAERAQWRRKIADAFLNEQGQDRLHAVESLAKLAYQIPEHERAIFERAAEGRDSGVALFARWVLARNGEAAQQGNRVAVYLRSNDMIARLRAGYILGQLETLSPTVRDELYAAAASEPAENLAHSYLVAAAFVVAKRAGQERQARRWHRELIQLIDTGSAPQRAAACQGFAAAGYSTDLPLMKMLLEDEDADVRAFAALAALRIQAR